MCTLTRARLQSVWRWGNRGRVCEEQSASPEDHLTPLWRRVGCSFSCRPTTNVVRHIDSMWVVERLVRICRGPLEQVHSTTAARSGLPELLNDFAMLFGVCMDLGVLVLHIAQRAVTTLTAPTHVPGCRLLFFAGWRDGWFNGFVFAEIAVPFTVRKIPPFRNSRALPAELGLDMSDAHFVPRQFRQPAAAPALSANRARAFVAARGYMCLPLILSRENTFQGRYGQDFLAIHFGELHRVCLLRAGTRHGTCQRFGAHADATRKA